MIAGLAAGAAQRRHAGAPRLLLRTVRRGGPAERRSLIFAMARASRARGDLIADFPAAMFHTSNQVKGKVYVV